MKEELARELLQKTRNDYDLIAEEFSQTRHNLWPELVEKFQGMVKDDDRVLDIGCGNGRLLFLLKGEKIIYTGVDNSTGQIEEAKKKFPEHNFLIADALSLPFGDASFDKVFAIALLHHMPSEALRQQVLGEARRVLKDQGILVLTVWDRWRSKRLGAICKYLFMKLMGRTELDFGDVFIPWKDNKLDFDRSFAPGIRSRIVQRYYHFFSKKEMLKLVESAGFKVVDVGLIRNETGQRQNLYLVGQKC